MKINHLDTYLFIIEHMEDTFLDALCEEHPKERISISMLKYLKEQKKILNSCTGRKAISIIADENGVSRGRIYRAIKSKG